MKIEKSEIGLVFKNGQLVSILETGKYNFIFGDVEIYSLLDKFQPKSTDLKILLSEEIIFDELFILEIDEKSLGIRFEKGKIIEILDSGKHAYWKKAVDSSQFEVFSLQNKFEPKIADFNVLVNDETISDKLQKIVVNDNEICFHYQDGNFKDVLKSGVHAFWKKFVNHSFEKYDITEPQIPKEIKKQILLKPELSEFVSILTVEPWEKGLYFIDNELQKIVDSGRYFFWKNSKDVKFQKVDIRQQQIEIQGQEIMSKDKVTLRFNFVCQYKIVDLKKSVLEIKNYANELYILLQLVLREYVGGFTLDEILLKKQEIGEYVTENLKEKAKNLGLDLIFAGVKDVILPGEIKDILNQVLIAEKKAQANVIMRREETASTRSLLNTVKLMENNELLYKLKELEYIERISEKINQISISGGNQILEQLKEIFISQKKS